MQQFSTNSLTSLSVRYEILNAAVEDGFSIDIVRSLDETFAPASADILLATLAINEPEDLTVGIHTLTFPIGGVPVRFHCQVPVRKSRATKNRSTISYWR